MNLHEVIEDEQWHDDGEEDRCRVADDGNRRDDREERVQEAAGGQWQDVVNCLNVARKPVENAADRSRLEEDHRRTKNVRQHVLVQHRR